MSSQQPPAIVTDPAALRNPGRESEATKQTDKKRSFTRAERRASGKQKRTVQLKQGPPHGRNATDKAAKKTAADVKSIDDMIAQLVALKRQHYQTNKTSKAALPAKRGLEARITRNAPKGGRKELSPEKLEKIRKRKEIRDEKRKAYLAKRAKSKQNADEKSADYVELAAVVEETQTAEVARPTEKPSTQEQALRYGEEVFEGIDFDDE